jgi:hypothetical protein
MDLSLVYMDGKLRHRPKTFMRVRDSKWPFLNSNCSNKREVGICLAAQTLFSVQPISRVLEVQMSSFLFSWKAEINSQNFHEIICLNSDFSNDFLFRQEDNGCHQVKRRPPTQ